MSTRKTVLLLVVVLFAVPAWSKVFVRWTQPVPPPAKRLGVHELAIPWTADAPSFPQGAAGQGYPAFPEGALGDVSSAAKPAARAGFAGILLNSADPQRDKKDQALRK